MSIKYLFYKILELNSNTFTEFEFLDNSFHWNYNCFEEYSVFYFSKSYDNKCLLKNLIEFYWHLQRFIRKSQNIKQRKDWKFKTRFEFCLSLSSFCLPLEKCLLKWYKTRIQWIESTIDCQSIKTRDECAAK